MKSILLVLMFSARFVSYGQNPSAIVKGAVRDSLSSQPLPMASVTLTTVSDSAKQMRSVVSQNGTFHFDGISAGSYKMEISHLDFKPVTKYFSISDHSLVQDLGVINMVRSYQTLNTVVVESKPAIKLSGDTITYNATKINTLANATSHDLMKKLPGLKVKRDGGISVQGEDVRKLLVDGKEYFGNEVAAAAQNIRADMVADVQVFDEQSSTSAFDDDKIKVVNLRLKKDKKHGMSGIINAGYGTTGTYTGGVTGNILRGNTITSLILKRQNISNDLLSQADNDAGGGITTKTSAGVNYTTLTKKLQISGSYFYNRVNSFNASTSNLQTFFNDSVVLNDRFLESDNLLDGHRLTQKVVYSIDSFNSIVSSSSVTVNAGRVLSSDSMANTIKDVHGEHNIGSTISSDNISRHSKAFSSNVIWKRKFKKPGRLLMTYANIAGTSNKNDNSKFISTDVKSVDDITNAENSSNYVLHNRNDVLGYNVGFSYSEPISSTKSVELNYGYQDKHSSLDRLNRSLEGDTELFGSDSLSNTFTQRNRSNRIGMNYRQRNKQYTFHLGMSIEKLIMRGADISRETAITQNNININPTASLQVKLSKNKHFRFYYFGRNKQPTALQQQDAIDLSQYPFIRKGNPSLKQEFEHYVTANYSTINPTNKHLFSASLFYNYSHNKIVNATEFNGLEYLVFPVNVNGNQGVTGTFDYSLPVPGLEQGYLSSTSRIRYARNTSIVNGQNNRGTNIMLEEDIGVNFDVDAKFFLDVQAALTYNSIRYQADQAQNSSFFSQRYSLDADYVLFRKYTISTTFDRLVYPTENEKAIATMWNASISRNLFRDDRAEITLRLNNLLDQRHRVSRIVHENNAIEDSRVLMRGRFVLLELKYHLNRFKDE